MFPRLMHFKRDISFRNHIKFSSEVNYPSLSNEEIIKLVDSKKLPLYSLEKALGDSKRAVEIRRQVLSSSDSQLKKGFEKLPLNHFDYSQVVDACCENVVGYIQIPVGIVGPLLLDGKEYSVPMATTEGALVASTHRGAKAITQSGGARSEIVNNGMTRAPVIKMPNLRRAAELKRWIEHKDNFEKICAAFNATSRFARLRHIKAAVSGRSVYLRFQSATGDAMGMNMVTKGVEKALQFLEQQFPDLDCLSISGNFCTDKKPSAVNWIEGRGKSVVCETIIKGEQVEKILKTTVKSMVEMNVDKNYLGSALAGSIGGFNAHASNIVTAIFLATGQDPAQNVESSNCLTTMEYTNDGKDLYIAVTMPSIEVGTVGGGTHLPSQSSCLEMLGIKGSSEDKPGSHSETLAKVISATVLAGELSLMSALSAGHLVKTHLAMNRKKH